MFSLLEIRHHILFQCHGIYIGVKKFNYKLENNILRNYSQKDLGVLRGDFRGFGCPNDSLLGKTMTTVNFWKFRPP